MPQAGRLDIDTTSQSLSQAESSPVDPACHQLRAVLDASAGKSLISEDGGAGFLQAAAEENGHPGLVSLAIQLGFVSRGVQVQTLLKSLAQTFADDFIAQAETRAEKLGSSLGMIAAVFCFMPFVLSMLTAVGVPLISTITGP
jgi:hypothetical protein